jgi:ABC-type glycerol-3-phosphate transport system permease component
VQKRLTHFLFYTVLSLAAIIFLVPLVWMVITSLKLNSEIGTIPFIFFPKRPVLENYVFAVTRFPFFGAMGRSILTALLSSIPLVISSSLVGFGFARYRAPGKNFLFLLMLSTILIPSLVTAIPQFIIYARLHLINTYWPWFLGGLGASPFFVFLYRQYFMGIPKELDDAAKLDGCSRFDIYWRIYMPNATPVTATTFIFSFLGNWSDFISPKLFLSESQATLAAKLASAYTDPKGNPLVAETMAAVVLYILPLVLIYILGQRYIYQISIRSGIK